MTSLAKMERQGPRYSPVRHLDPRDPSLLQKQAPLRPGCQASWASSPPVSHHDNPLPSWTGKDMAVATARPRRYSLHPHTSQAGPPVGPAGCLGSCGPELPWLWSSEHSSHGSSGACLLWVCVPGPPASLLRALPPATFLHSLAHDPLLGMPSYRLLACSLLPGTHQVTARNPACSHCPLCTLGLRSRPGGRNSDC